MASDVRHGGVGILGERVAPDGLRVAVDEGLPPRERAERQEHAGPDDLRPGKARGARRREGDERQACQVLEVVGHERVAHRVDVDEPERGREGRSVAEHGDERPAPDPPSCEVESRHGRGRREGEQVLPPDGRVDVPARVDEGERVRPDELGGVEPERAPGDQAAVEPREAPELSGRPDVVRLHPRGHESRGRAQRQEGEEGGTSTRPRLHQRTRRTTTGRVQVTAFARSAPTKSPRARP